MTRLISSGASLIFLTLATRPLAGKLKSSWALARTTKPNFLPRKSNGGEPKVAAVNPCFMEAKRESTVPEKLYVFVRIEAGVFHHQSRNGLKSATKSVETNGFAL